MSNERPDYVSQYITTVIQGVKNTFPYFYGHQYYEACHNLLPIIHFSIITQESSVKALQTLSDRILNIEADAQARTTGEGRDERTRTYQSALNTLGHEIYLDALKLLSGAIKEDILSLARFKSTSLEVLRLDKKGEKVSKPVFFEPTPPPPSGGN